MNYQLNAIFIFLIQLYMTLLINKTSYRYDFRHSFKDCPYQKVQAARFLMRTTMTK